MSGRGRRRGRGHGRRGVGDGDVGMADAGDVSTTRNSPYSRGGRGRSRGRGRTIGRDNAGFEGFRTQGMVDVSEGRGRGRGLRRPWGSGRGRSVVGGSGGTQDGHCVVVSNLPQCTEQELVLFLQNHAKRPVNMSDFHFSKNGDRAFLSVQTKGECVALVKLSGIRWKEGVKLLMKEVWQKTGGRSNVQHTASLGFVWAPVVAQFVESRFDTTSLYLNLSSLATQPELQEVKLDLNSRNAATAVFQIIGAKCPSVVTINFASNNIRSLGAFTELHKHCPTLVNLSFDTNLIADFKELDHLKGLKIRELILVGNPIQSKTNIEAYRSEISHRFPHVQLLDREAIQPLINFDIPAERGTLLPASLGSFADTAENQALAVDFLQKFFEVYDSNRPGLLDAYGDDSLFSLTIDSAHDAKADRKDFLHAYMPQSRNLIRVNEPSKRMELLRRGRIDIVHTLSNLPPSRHNLGSPSCVVDVHSVNNMVCQVVCINVHGDFWEGGSETRRSFDRTLLLTPPPAGFATKWPAIVMNDSLHVRSFVAGKAEAPPPFVAPTPTGMPLTPVHGGPSLLATLPLGSAMASTSSAGTTIPGIVATLPDQQQVMVSELSKQTGLDLTLAKQCLEEQTWVFPRAMAAAEQFKARFK